MPGNRDRRIRGLAIAPPCSIVATDIRAAIRNMKAELAAEQPANRLQPVSRRPMRSQHAISNAARRPGGRSGSSVCSSSMSKTLRPTRNGSSHSRRAASSLARHGIHASPQPSNPESATSLTRSERTGGSCHFGAHQSQVEFRRSAMCISSFSSSHQRQGKSAYSLRTHVAARPDPPNRQRIA